jgi:hypothetical protein
MRTVVPDERISVMISNVRSTMFGARPSEGSLNELRPRHQRAADCKHLLLAPRQRSARLQSPLGQAWKLFKDACLLPSTPPLALISSAAIFAPLAT